MAQDWRSRVIVGFRVVESGNEHSLLLGFSDGADTFGLPKQVVADNGKNFTSYQWRGNTPQRRTYLKAGEFAQQTEGIFALCDIQPSWCLPYNPNGKARLERWFGALDDQFCKSFPSYCGKSPEGRPDAHVKLVQRAVEWDVFVAKLHEYVRVYNDTPHSGEGMDDLTPVQVMNTRARKRPLPDDLRPLLLAAWQRPVTVGRNGVTLSIAGARITYGRNHPALNALPLKTKVRVSYDPLDIRRVHVWTMDYAHVCRAEMNERFNRSIPSEAMREQMRIERREKRTLRAARDIGLEHALSTTTRAVASLNQDAEKRRKPDPVGPAGGPLFVPVQTPIKPVRDVAAELRAAVVADGGEFARRMKEHAASSDPEPVVKPVWEALSDWAKRERA